MKCNEQVNELILDQDLNIVHILHISKVLVVT